MNRKILTLNCLKNANPVNFFFFSSLVACLPKVGILSSTPTVDLLVLVLDSEEEEAKLAVLVFLFF